MTFYELETWRPRPGAEAEHDALIRRWFDYVRASRRSFPGMGVDSLLPRFDMDTKTQSVWQPSELDLWLMAHSPLPAGERLGVRANSKS
jgi:hypothetical protein